MAIEGIQRRLHEKKLDGWLIYDWCGSNPFFTKLFPQAVDLKVSRPLFYWIPQRGEPEKLIHAIEVERASLMEGKLKSYLSYQDRAIKLQEILRKAKRIAMEYAANNPSLSVVDGATLELIRTFSIDIVSSAPLLEERISILNEEALASHRAAVAVLHEALECAWAFIARCVRSQELVTEYDVQQLLLKVFKEQGCIAKGTPICAVNAHSASPHYSAPSQGSSAIRRGDYVLIDLWCKKDHPGAIYADLTQVGVAESHATPKQQALFGIVREAQERVIQHIRSSFDEQRTLRGADADACARAYITGAGFGPYFLHRTGHSIDEEVHGLGTNLDSFETLEERLLVPSSCFSLEPAIYLPHEIGVRLETNVVITAEREVVVTGGLQQSILTI